MGFAFTWVLLSAGSSLGFYDSFVYNYVPFTASATLGLGLALGHFFGVAHLCGTLYNGVVASTAAG